MENEKAASSKRVVAYCGKYGAGKSYLTNKCFGDAGIVLSFADELRQELIKMNLVSEEEVYLKPTPQHIRNILVSHGRFRREQDSNYWTKKWLIKAKSVDSNLIFVDDLRYLNEYDAIKEVDQDATIFYLGEKSNDFELESLHNLADYYITRHK